MLIDRDPHCNIHRVKEKIHIRLHSNNINRDSRIESPEARLPLIKKHSNRRSVRQWTSEEKAHTNNGVRNTPISAANNRPTRTRSWSHKFTCDQSTKTSKARSLSVAFSHEHLIFAVETSRSATSFSD